MRKRIAAAAVGVALMGVPVAANGAPQPIEPHWRPYQERYFEIRKEYIAEFGLGAAGRDIVRNGRLDGDGDVLPATRAQVVRSTERMEGALDPATTVSAPETSAASTAYAPSASSSTIQCESGGDYTADTGNGYYGAYQFDQSTWDAYAPSGYAGTNPAAAPPSVQDATAASVPYDAWPSC